MHRLENLLVAIELKHVLSTSFPEGAEVTAQTVSIGFDKKIINLIWPLHYQILQYDLTNLNSMALNLHLRF